MSESYKPLPEAADLWELFSYNPLTGNLHWRESRGKEKRDSIAGTPTESEIQIGLFYSRWRAHRLIWRWRTGEDPGTLTIDHKDRNPFNNRLSNLRKANHSQQASNKNMRSNNTSGIRGVQWHKASQKWMARVNKDKKQHYLGLFTSPEEAHQAYCAAAERLHGDFAA